MSSEGQRLLGQQHTEAGNQEFAAGVCSNKDSALGINSEQRSAVKCLRECGKVVLDNSLLGSS